MPKVRIGHNVSNAKINSDGTFTDDYTRTFEDMVVKPRRTELKRGSYSANNWNYAKAHRKDWMKTHWPSAVVDDKPLEEVYPEFDLISLSPALKPLVKKGLTSAIIKPIKPYADEAKQFVKDITWQIRPERMEAVNNAFRNSEWSNFLSTRNGDNYYRMVNPKIERYSPKEKYFLSHTTPWEEFSGGGTELPIGTTKLYEFPTSTFGRLRSTTSKCIPTEYDVTELGRQHLLYGNTASGVRGPVRLMSDANAKFLGESAFGIRPVERPLTKNGLFDANPDFENIHMGNQTVLKGRTIERALNESTYNIFENSPFGIIKTIHVPN